VTLTLIRSREERVTVIGAVNQPGEIKIPYDSPLDLVTAIAAAGGPADFADVTKISLKRGNETESYSLNELQTQGAQQVLLKNGDRINVGLNRFSNTSITIIGQIEKASTYPFPKSGRNSHDAHKSKRAHDAATR